MKPDVMLECENLEDHGETPKTEEGKRGSGTASPLQENDRHGEDQSQRQDHRRHEVDGRKPASVDVVRYGNAQVCRRRRESQRGGRVGWKMIDIYEFCNTTSIPFTPIEK